MVRSFLPGILALALGAAPASAALYIVDRFDESPDATTCSADTTDKDCSLRGAILAANANPGSDSILLPAGVYTLTLAGDEQVAGDAGDLDVTESLGIQGAAGTIIQGCEPAAGETDCVGLDRIFHLHGAAGSSVTVRFQNLTIQHGTTKGAGGGILVDAGVTLRLDSSSVVQHNGADGDGGGIAAASGATVLLTNAIIRANASGGRGGGIFTGALGPDPVGGGAVSLAASTVEDNTAGAGGGGIARMTGALTVATSTIARNQSAVGLDDAYAGSGGGVFIGRDDDLPSVISNSTVSGNVGHVAGGIVALGPISLRDVTVTANEMHSTGNGAGGVATVDSLRIQNTIIAGNRADTSQPNDCLGGVVSGGYNLIGDGGQCALQNGVGGDLVGTQAAPVDPKLGPLALNAGPTRTHALLPGSPAIDAGDPASPGSSADACTPTDQSGTPRGVAQTGRCDIGAVELFGSGTTTTTVESTTSTTETSTTETTTTIQATSTTLVVSSTSTTTTTESTTSTSVASTTIVSTTETSTSLSTTTSETSTSTSSTSTSESTTSTTETTTSTSSSSTSTTSSSTTSTSSSSSTSTSSTSLPPPVEICGNCLDDDGNGLTDFEDPACCQQLQLAAMSIQKAGLAVTKGNTTLKLTASLVQAGLSAGGAADQDVYFQLRRANEPDVLCAHIPAANVTRKKSTLRFRDKKHVVGSAVGLDSLVLKGKKTGGGTLTIGASRLAFALPPAGDVQITFGLRNPQAAETGNRCTTAQIALKAGKKGGLKFP